MIWSAYEIEYLSQNVKKGAYSIAKTLNRSYPSVVQKAYMMRLSFTGKTLKNVAYSKRSRDSQNKAPWKSDLPPFHEVMLGLYPDAIHVKRKLWRRRRAIILKMHDDACYYCGDPANTVDHIKIKELSPLPFPVVTARFFELIIPEVTVPDKPRGDPIAITASPT